LFPACNFFLASTSSWLAVKGGRPLQIYKQSIHSHHETSRTSHRKFRTNQRRQSNLWRPYCLLVSCMAFNLPQFLLLILPRSPAGGCALLTVRFSLRIRHPPNKVPQGRHLLRASSNDEQSAVPAGRQGRASVVYLTDFSVSRRAERANWESKRNAASPHAARLQGRDPLCLPRRKRRRSPRLASSRLASPPPPALCYALKPLRGGAATKSRLDRKSTRLNSSH
jgi:hypothetical protein